MTDVSIDDDVPATKADLKKATRLIVAFVIVGTGGLITISAGIAGNLGASTGTVVLYGLTGFVVMSFGYAIGIDGAIRRLWNRIPSVTINGTDTTEEFSA